MKKLLYISTVAALLLFTGCSDKEPVVEETTETSAPAAEEVTVIDESNAADTNEIAMESNNLDSGSMSRSALEARLSPVYFAFDKYNLTSDDIDILSENTKIFNKNVDGSKFAIKLEGNCDEWGSDEYNFALGLKRANSVKDELLNEGIAASRITLVSYGSSSPVCTEKTHECWSKNRRVDFKLLP